MTDRTELETRSESAKRKKLPPQVPWEARVVDPPVTWAPHDRVSDPTAHLLIGAGGLASAEPNIGSLAGQRWSDKRESPRLEHRRGRFSQIYRWPEGCKPVRVLCKNLNSVLIRKIRKKHLSGSSLKRYAQNYPQSSRRKRALPLGEPPRCEV